MLEFAAAASLFIAVTAAVLALTGRSSTLASRSARASERRLHGLRREASGGGLEASNLLTRSASNLPGLRNLTSKDSSWAAKGAAELRQAGSQLKVGEYLLIRLSVAVISFAAVLVLGRGGGIGLLLAVLAAAVGYILPALYVRWRRARRLEAINSQLVEALQLMSNALRSGFAFTQAVELAARQLQPPLQDELNNLLRDTSLGANSDEALRALVDRTGSIDVEMIVTTILVQRTTGGNLSEILDNVAATIRERERLHGEIKALTASQRLTGMVLSVYPIFLGAGMFALMPSVMSGLWQEDVGRVLLVIAITLQVIGAFSIRQLLKLDV